MEQNCISISIPTELKQYEKTEKIISESEILEDSCQDFGVKLIKNINGTISQAEYYSESGDILKKVYYKGSAVSCIEHFRYGKMRSQETYTDGLILRKSIFDNNLQLLSSISYEYNRKGDITAVKKTYKQQKYEIFYGYDDLNRPNSRELRQNSKVLDKQIFRFDIIDRIVEYEDKNQKIKVEKVNPNNELVKYLIKDCAGNTIDIYNKFLCSEYIGTDISLNGHKTTVKDRSYLDNVMLKKPYPSVDDLDLAFSGYINKYKVLPIKRMCNTDIAENIINKQKSNVLPISVRKLHLIQNIV